MKHKKNYLSILSMLFALSLLTFVSCTGDGNDDGLINNGGGSLGPTQIHNGHEYVDLGLSVKWATCNVGATTPEEYGDYFAWGEIVPQSYYYYWNFLYDANGFIVLDSDGRPLFRESISEYSLTEDQIRLLIDTDDWFGVDVVATLPTGQHIPAFAYYEATFNYYAGTGKNLYKFYNSSWGKLSKYCTDSESGMVDNKTVLELEDDAARVNWGGKWRMPTKAEQDELRNTNNCTWKWTIQNGVKGYKVTSIKNGNSIFLPAAGFRDGRLGVMESFGNYCSSSLSSSNRFVPNYGAFSLFFNSSFIVSTSVSRYSGWTVRPVCD